MSQWEEMYRVRVQENEALMEDISEIRVALGRLSMAMGNPAVHWDERSSIEVGLIEEAIRRFTAQRPGDAIEK